MTRRPETKRNTMPLDSTFSLQQPFEAILFDCDGTLVDSAGAHLAAYNVALEPRGVTMPWDWYSTRLGIPARDLLALFAAERQIDLLLDEMVRAYDLAFRRELACVREVTVVADIARAYSGKVPLAVASNGTRHHVQESLRGAGLLSLFPVLVGRDEVPNAKPAPDLYLEAALRLGVPASTCIVFEDSAEGILAAHRAGMRAYDVTTVLGVTPSVRG